MPFASYAASFDCSKARSLAEITICNDAELSRMDDELGQIYRSAKAVAPDKKAFQVATQVAWQRRERDCRTRSCIANWYSERKSSLLAVIQSSGVTGAASPIICESSDSDKQITSIWPSLYLSSSGALCFDVKGWPDFTGNNCVANGKDAHWTGLVIVMEDGESQGRDSTNFRALQPVINDEQISYTIEWSRGTEWRPMQHVAINRLTGEAVSYFVTMHGGESYKCHLGKKAL